MSQQFGSEVCDLPPNYVHYVQIGAFSLASAPRGGYVTSFSSMMSASEAQHPVSTYLCLWIILPRDLAFLNDCYSQNLKKNYSSVHCYLSWKPGISFLLSSFNDASLSANGRSPEASERGSHGDSRVRVLLWFCRWRFRAVEEGQCPKPGFPGSLFNVISTRIAGVRRWLKTWNWF